MGTKKAKKINKQIKEAQKAIAAIDEKLPPKQNLKYEATMDNVIIEIIWKKQEEGKPYERPHIRGVEKNVVLAVGPSCPDKRIKPGVRVMVSSFGREAERDEISAISCIKAHEVTMIVTE